MSVSLNPSNFFGFHRPLTQLPKRSLTITNNNIHPIAFKVKTTAPKLYCILPNSGRVEPGQAFEVSIMLQAMREGPPPNAKCKDKFLIQSILITSEKESWSLQDIWAAPEGAGELKVYQQKLRVTYLPPEGQTIPEEAEPQVPPVTDNLPPIQPNGVHHSSSSNEAKQNGVHDDVDHTKQDFEPNKQPIKEYADIGIQAISTDVDLRADQNVSLLLLLGKLRNRKTDGPISEVVSLLMVDIFRKLLGTNDYVNMASLIHDSDAGVFLDFVLCLLNNNYLPNLDLLDANRRARRLLLKMAPKKLPLPNSMFISHVRIDQSFVGWGGYADVYKGEFRGKPVAVKMLRANSQSEVCREALTWKSLSHKFILPFLGIYQEKAQLFLVSPFMNNGNLSAWRKKSDPSIGEVQKRLLEVAEGLQYIHVEGIVHGDIRGSNILLDSDFHVKIADFGLTRHLEATATKSTSFSPNFAAPELFGTWDDDDWSDSDDDCTGVVRTHKSDVYAFGCLYYEIHFSAIPFEDMAYLQLMKQVTRYRKRPDRLREPPLSDKAWKLIKRCWIHEASRRPTMEEVIESMVKWDIK